MQHTGNAPDKPTRQERTPAGRYLRRGLFLHTQAHTPGAIQHYRQAVQLEPGNTLGHYLLGLALCAQGHSREARSHWRIAVTQRPQGEKAAWARQMAARLLERTDDGNTSRPA